MTEMQYKVEVLYTQSSFRQRDAITQPRNLCVARASSQTVSFVEMRKFGLCFGESPN